MTNDAVLTARRYRLRRIVGHKGMWHILECGHRIGAPHDTWDEGEQRDSRRCRECPIPSQVCTCSPHTGHPVCHWKDEHRRGGCLHCGCHRFHPVQRDLT
jgi:hypothetical protein